MRQSIGPRLRKQWQMLSRLPGGHWLFSRLLGTVVPYTGTLGAVVTTLEPGHCIVKLKDRRRVRNHLRSVHAIALANLGEMATGLALLSNLPDGMRAILIGFEANYLKKARGPLSAESRCGPPPDRKTREITVTADIRDASGDVTTTVVARWLTAPERDADGN